MTPASAIVFGSMRMSLERQPVSGWVKLLAHMHCRGVRALHSSDEYDSFPLFCEVLAVLASEHPDLRFRHVVKLGEPSFDHDGFSEARLRDHVARYSQTLGTAVVHDIQWMWRKDLKDEPARLLQLAESLGHIDAAFAALKRDGLIERAYCFPYTVGCAELMIDVAHCDGLIVYRNAAERDFDPLLDRVRAAGRSAMIIRPFMAGATLGEADAPPAATQFAAAIDHPAIEGGIVSISSVAHFDELLD